MASSEARIAALRRLGPYEIEAPIGEGGMGVVWRGRHAETRQVAAVKVLRAIGEPYVEAFRREVRALGRIDHPGVVRILGDGVDAGTPWYAMEEVQGVTLRTFAGSEIAGADTQGSTLNAPIGAAYEETIDAAEEGQTIAVTPSPVALPRTLRVMARLAGTLAYLHAEGVVHRDLKPDNVIVTPSDRPVLVDFGLVSRFRGAAGREAIDAATDGLGTAVYAAPEQIRRDLVDARADLYAFGVMLFEIVAGRPPFRGGVHDVVVGHLARKPPAFAAKEAGKSGETVTPLRDLPDALVALIFRLLEKDPHDRPAYASDVADALWRILGAPSETPEIGAPQLYRARLAGRGDALEALTRASKSAQSGRGQVIFVSGPSGSGKTRLVIEALQRAKRGGLHVAAGGASAQLGQVPVDFGASAPEPVAPLAPLAPLLRLIAERARGRSERAALALLGPHAKVLSAYEPSILGVPGVHGLPDPPELSPSAARDRAIEAVRHALFALAETEPIAIAVDDLQWADELTVDLLAGLAPAIRDRRIAVFGLFRAGEAPPAIARAAGTARTIALGSIDRGALRAIAADMLGQDEAPEALASAIENTLDPSPLFVSETLHAAAEAGLLRRSGGWRFASDAPLPASLSEVVARRLAGLPPAARALIEAAAVLGRAFDPEDAAFVADLGVRAETEAASAIDVLRQRHMIEGLDDDAGAGATFTHDALREGAYSAAGARRSELHRRAAERLQARGARGADFAALAHHFHLAGDLAAAIPCADRAAEWALGQAAYREAARLFQCAIAWDQAIGMRADAQARARWHRKTSAAHFATADFEGSAREAARALAALGVEVPTRSGTWIRLVAKQAWIQAFFRHTTESQPDETTVEQALAAGQLATTFYFSGAPLPVIGMLLFAANQAERAGVTLGVTTAYARIGYVAGLSRLDRVAAAYFDRAANTRSEAASPEDRATSLYLDAFHQLGRGAWDSVERLCGEAAAIFETIGDRQEAEVARTIASHALYYRGRAEEALSVFRAITEQARSRDNAQHVGWGLFLGARSSLTLGRIDEALSALGEARTAMSRVDDRLSSPIGEGLFAEALLASGRGDEAARVARALLPSLSGAPLPLAPCMHAYAGAIAALTDAWRAGDAGAAREVAALLARFALFAGMFPIAAPAFLASLGEAFEVGGLPRLAGRCFGQSLKIAEARAMPYAAARAKRLTSGRRPAGNTR